MGKSCLLTPQHCCRVAIAIMAGDFGLEDCTVIFRDGMGGVTTEWFGKGAGVEVTFNHSSSYDLLQQLSVGCVYNGRPEWVHLDINNVDRGALVDEFKERIFPAMQQLAFKVWSADI
jgi:hypothetical protein